MPEIFSKHDRSVQLEDLALFTHGSLTTLHVLGVLYHLRRNNKRHLAVHALGALYSGAATIEHKIYRDELKSKTEK